jgi:hypothetical protein
MTKAEMESMRVAITQPGLLGASTHTPYTTAHTGGNSNGSGNGNGGGGGGDGGGEGGAAMVGEAVAREKTLYIEVIKLHPMCINITFTQDPDIPLAGQLVPASMNGPLSNMLRVFINTFGAMLGTFTILFN